MFRWAGGGVSLTEEIWENEWEVEGGNVVVINLTKTNLTG